MQALAIVAPTRVIATAYGPAGFSRALSPNPKEATPLGTLYSVELDFGVEVAIDTVFIGYHNAQPGAYWTVERGSGSGIGTGDMLVPQQSMRLPGYGPPYHGFYRSPEIKRSRYFILTLNGNGTPAFSVGVVTFGLSWSASWGHEWGAGRFIEDTGTAERLFGGGFGIDDGVAAGGYQWTFGDLQPAETEFLYQLVKERRTTRSVLVVEDPEQTDGLNSRIHWGLFSKLEPYERLDPLNTKWALQIRDWA